MRDKSRSIVIWEMDRTPVNRIVGRSDSFLASFMAPKEPSDCIAEWQIVSELECWFAECGSQPLILWSWDDTIQERPKEQDRQVPHDEVLHHFHSYWGIIGLVDQHSFARHSYDLVSRFRSFLCQKARTIKIQIRKQALRTVWRQNTSQKCSLDRRLEFGANLAGFFTGRFGIAASSRAFAQALELAQVPHVLNNVVSRTHGERHPSTLPLTSENPYAINLIHVNPDTAGNFILSRTSLISGPRYFSGKYNIGIWYWETSRFPARWIPLLRFYDEIWATSSFTVQSLSKVSPIPVVKMRYPLFVDTSLIDRTARRKLDLQDDQCVFLFVFDFASVLERKNPLALISAFEQAFSHNDKAVLVLSHINSTLNPSWARKLEKASANLNVKILSKHLSEQEYVSVLAACDCYVSLHRSEGLGLPMAEAMYLGKTVIATAYGGNVDFMNASNSLPLDYKLVELDRDYGPYEKGSLWAEPDVEQAVELMRSVCADRELARAIGRSAADNIREFMNPAIASQEIRARLEFVYSNSFAQTS